MTDANANLSDDDDSVARLEEDIGEAIKIRTILYQRSLDKKFEDNNGLIIYAVDCNILNHYFNSHETSSTRRRRLFEYLAFRGPSGTERSEEETKIGEVIIHFLIMNFKSPLLGDETPLLLLPGHNTEARNLWSRLVYQFDAHTERSQNTKAKLIEILDSLERKKPGQEREAYLKESENYLHELLYRLEAPHEKFRMFNELLVSRRLLNFEKAGYHPRLEQLRSVNSSQSVFFDFDSISRDSINEGTAEWWMKRLYKQIPLPFLQIDLLALSTLDKLNRKLEFLDTRVILLTQNDEIIRAGHRYRPYKHSDSTLGQYSFSDLYLRHPRCLLSEPEIIKPQLDHANSADISWWLDAFLVEIIGDGFDDLLSFKEKTRKLESSLRLKEIAEVALKRKPALHTQLYDNWRSHVMNISFAHSSTSNEAKRTLLEKLGSSELDRIAVLGGFEEFTKDLTEQSWNNFFLTAARIGYDLIGISPEKLQRPKRTVPLIYLRGSSDEGDAVSLINQAGSVLKNESAIIKKIEKLESRCDVAGRYQSTLCCALLFGHADRWPIAELIGRRAIHIARSRDNSENMKPKTISDITGREAYFFTAVAHRFNAKSADDLDECDNLLAQADAAQSQECGGESAIEDCPSVDGNRLPLTGVRFNTERISVEMTRLLFYASGVQWRIGDDAGIASRVLKMMELIRVRIDEATTCRHDLIRRSCLINLRRNFFSCVFFLEYAGKLESVDRSELSDFVDKQSQDIEFVHHHDNQLRLSVIDIYLMAYAASFFGGINQAKAELMEHYYQLQEMIASGNMLVTPYDLERYRRIDQLVAQRA